MDEVIEERMEYRLHLEELEDSWDADEQGEDDGFEL